jgi:hypothetical protein
MASIQKALAFAAEIRARREAAAAPPAPATIPPKAAHVSGAGPGVSSLLRAGQVRAPAKPSPALKAIPPATGVGLARVPALGEALGFSGKKFLPAGVKIGAFAARIGRTLAQLEDYNGRPVGAQEGPAWIYTQLPEWVATRRAREASAHP